MKIAIDPGHNCAPDTGASGIRQEDQLSLEVSEKVIKKLRYVGHQVINVLPDYCRSVSDSLSQRVNMANSMEVDIYVSIHFNAFNGRTYGSEVFFGSRAGKAIAEKVLTEIVSLGFHNRGVKNGLHLYVIRATKMPAILIECCFCDAAGDMSIYDAESMADAIVFGLIGKQTILNNLPVSDRILIVERDTTLKQLTFNSNNVKGGAKQRIPLQEISLSPGEYPFTNLLFEEGHYCVEFKEKIGKGIDFGCLLVEDATIKS